METRRNYDLEFRNLMKAVAEDDLTMTDEEFAELGIDLEALGTVVKARLLETVDAWARADLDPRGAEPASPPRAGDREVRQLLVERMRRAEALLPRSAEACRRIYERLRAAQTGLANPAFAEAFRDRGRATDAGVRQTLVDLYATGSITEEDLRDDRDS
jgi:hypothetical protein